MTLEDVRKKGNRILLFALGTVIGFFLFIRSCNSEPKTIQTKEKSGSFAENKVINTPIFERYAPEAPKAKTTLVYSEADKQLIAKLQKENEQLVNRYVSSSDSLQRIILEQAIRLNSFTKTWENSDLKATVSGIARGAVESIKLDYTIKPQSVKCPENPFRVLGGFEVGATEGLDAFNAKANLGFQNRKGNIFNIGFDTQQKIYIGYSTTLINF